MVEAARHLDSKVAQEIDVVIERKRVGVMRQRELLILERHCLPEGRAKLASLALVQIRRQIDEYVGARIAPDLLILDPEYIGRLAPG